MYFSCFLLFKEQFFEGIFKKIRPINFGLPQMKELIIGPH